MPPPWQPMPRFLSEFPEFHCSCSPSLASHAALVPSSATQGTVSKIQTLGCIPLPANQGPGPGKLTNHSPAHQSALSVTSCAKVKTSELSVSWEPSYELSRLPDRPSPRSQCLYLSSLPLSLTLLFSCPRAEDAGLNGDF